MRIRPDASLSSHGPPPSPSRMQSSSFATPASNPSLCRVAALILAKGWMFGGSVFAAGHGAALHEDRNDRAACGVRPRDGLDGSRVERRFCPLRPDDDEQDVGVGARLPPHIDVLRQLPELMLEPEVVSRRVAGPRGDSDHRPDFSVAAPRRSTARPNQTLVGLTAPATRRPD